MKKMIKRLVILVLVLICSIFMAGCGTNKYNAKLYDNAVVWINEDFINSNLTSNAFYDDIQTNGTYPSSRVFIIKSNDDKLICFNDDFDVDIDFEKEMLIVYTWTTVYQRDCQIKSVEMVDDILYVNCSFSSVAIGVGDSSRPFQRWIVIKLDSLSVMSVQFELTV